MELNFLLPNGTRSGFHGFRKWWPFSRQWERHPRAASRLQTGMLLLFYNVHSSFLVTISLLFWEAWNGFPGDFLLFFGLCLPAFGASGASNFHVLDMGFCLPDSWIVFSDSWPSLSRGEYEKHHEIWLGGPSATVGMCRYPIRENLHMDLGLGNILWGHTWCTNVWYLPGKEFTRNLQIWGFVTEDLHSWGFHIDISAYSCVQLQKHL